jgi:uncharacterized DUF497 family protein
MRIVWDGPKRLQNLAKHDLDFADLTLEFFLTADVIASREGRFLAVGTFRDKGVIVVVTRPLGSEALSVISMRPASHKERSRTNE